MRQSIAKEIDKLAKQLLIVDGNFETAALKQTMVALFEKLTVLEYLERDTTKLAKKDTASLDSKSYREENWFKEPEAVPAPDHDDALVEPVMEKIKDLVAQMPQESQEVDNLLKKILPEKKYIKNDLEEFASRYQKTPTFERKVDVEKKDTDNLEPILEKKAPSKGVNAPSNNQGLLKDKGISEKPKSLNDTISGSLKLGLNDRIAFTKHLFDDNADDLQRVLSQINTLTSIEEANTFIQNQVKPDYNNWVDKVEFEERFMMLLEKRFN